MKKEIIERTLKEAEYLIETEKTIREISKEFHKSKSTIHKDLSERLKEISESKYREVYKILKNHIDVRHIRGGESTRKKYLNLR